MGIGRSGARRNKSATFWPIPESHLDTNLTASLVRDETLDPQNLYEDDQPMIDKPLAPTGTMPGTFSPLVRAVIDSVTEGIVIFDQQGRLLYANASARRVIDGQNGDVRNRLQSLGARFAPLKSGKLAETARRLGISRTTLWRRLKSYGMEGFRASP